LQADTVHHAQSNAQSVIIYMRQRSAVLAKAGRL